MDCHIVLSGFIRVFCCFLLTFPLRCGCRCQGAIFSVLESLLSICSRLQHRGHNPLTTTPATESKRREKTTKVMDRSAIQQHSALSLQSSRRSIPIMSSVTTPSNSTGPTSPGFPFGRRTTCDPTTRARPSKYPSCSLDRSHKRKKSNVYTPRTTFNRLHYVCRVERYLPRNSCKTIRI